MSVSRREMNPRRVAKSVRTHQATMAALGNAALSNVGDLSHSQDHPNIDPSDPHGSFLQMLKADNPRPRMTNSNQMYSGFGLWRKPKSVNIVGSADQKIDSQQRKGLITQGEASSEKLENGLRNPGSFHSPVNAGDNVEKGGHKATVRKHIPTEDF
jgi:hypothetical protein